MLASFCKLSSLLISQITNAGFFLLNSSFLNFFFFLTFKMSYKKLGYSCLEIVSAKKILVRCLQILHPAVEHNLVNFVSYKTRITSLRVSQNMFFSFIYSFSFLPFLPFLPSFSFFLFRQCLRGSGSHPLLYIDLPMSPRDPPVSPNLWDLKNKLLHLPFFPLKMYF